jgi:hypothetical protein
VEFALKKRQWWRSDEELTTEEWKQYKSVLAASLPYDALVDVKFAVREVNNASLLGCGFSSTRQARRDLFGANGGGAHSSLGKHEKGAREPYAIPSLTHRLEFLGAGPLGSDLCAVTRRAALGGVDARERAGGGPGDAGGVDGARHADLISGGMGIVTDRKWVWTENPGNSFSKGVVKF